MIQDLSWLVENGYVSKTKHPQFPLYIYNYTPKTVFKKLWTETTKICRGLILDENNKIIARPFSKFFNLEELNPSDIPTNMPYEIYIKMDGSLGILYWWDNMPYIATRGSFNSEQAIKATRILHKYYSNGIILDKKLTYLFEIIYPENKIVVDYGYTEDLFLLAAININTGEELSIKNIKIFPVVETYDIPHTSFSDLKNLNQGNSEGFVIKFENNFRFKIKFENYIKLHSIITRMSNIRIWELLKEGISLNDLLQQVPEELKQWVEKTATNLILQYYEVLRYCMTNYKTFSTRKETALYFMTLNYTSIMFMILDNMDPTKKIWDTIKPEYQKFYAPQTKEQ